MKILKKVLLLFLVTFLIIVFYNFPKLNIIAAYSAKNTASSVFIGQRSLEFTDNNDNNFSPISLSDDTVNSEEKSATSMVFGLLKRKAVFREGFGSTLMVDGKPLKELNQPKRLKPNNTTPFPYGNAEPQKKSFSNIDYNKLNKAVDDIFEDVNKTRAVLVIYKDQIIAEKYADGLDKDSRLLGWSMTKSITGTLFGILHCKGAINLHSKAPISEWQNDERQNITIHNLLQMNSGLEWTEDYNSISDATKMLFLQDDMTKTQIHKPLTGKPNQTWNYSSGTTNLLSGILRQQFKTHQDYLDFWYTELIDKIGMNSMVVETDLSGNYVGSSYAWATPRDWAKLGLLYLHNGQWNGENLFDKDWVDYATTPTPTSNTTESGGYGAQIWLNTGNRYPDIPKSTYFFNGYQGQNVVIFPENDLVVVRMGLTKNADFNTFLGTIFKSIN